MLRRVVYQYWTGGGMPPARKACFDATREGVFGVPIELVTDDRLTDYVVPGHPLHPCFPLLSAVHRADYMRCYLLRFHGGGWADIKKYSTDNNWAESFSILADTPGADALGVPERVNGLAFSPSFRTQSHAAVSVVAGYLIAKADTPFTRMWYERVNRFLSMMRPMLERHPGTDGAFGAPGYPLPFYSVLGEQLHYTCVKIGAVRPGAVLRSLRSGREDVPYR